MISIIIYLYNVRHRRIFENDSI